MGMMMMVMVVMVMGEEGEEGPISSMVEKGHSIWGVERGRIIQEWVVVVVVVVVHRTPYKGPSKPTSTGKG